MGMGTKCILPTELPELLTKWKLVCVSQKTCTPSASARFVPAKWTDGKWMDSPPYRGTLGNLWECSGAHIRFFGSGPNRGQSPLEWGDFPSVRRLRPNQPR